MIGTQELIDAMDKVKTFEKDGPPWHINMESLDIDPNAILDCAAEHADMLCEFGLIMPQDRGSNAISFGAGFTLAVLVLAERYKND